MPRQWVLSTGCTHRETEDKGLRIPTQLSDGASPDFYFPALEVIQGFKSQFGYPSFRSGTTS